MNSQIITVAADGSPASQQAFAWAIGEAAGRGFAVELVTAYQRQPGQEDSVARAIAEETINATIGERVVSAGHAAAVSWHVLEGEPIDVLVRESAHSSLLVMGRHSVSGIRHNAMGSVTDMCARMSDCPVVIVGPAPPMNEGSSSQVVASPDTRAESPESLGEARQGLVE